MSRLAVRCLVAAMAASFGGVLPLAAAAASSSGGAALQAIAQQYYRDLWHADPVSATNIGVQAYDGELGSYGPADVARDIARNRAAVNALQHLSDRALSLDDYTDKIRTATTHSAS